MLFTLQYNVGEKERVYLDCNEKKKELHSLFDAFSLFISFPFLHFSFYLYFFAVLELFLYFGFIIFFPIVVAAYSKVRNIFRPMTQGKFNCEFSRFAFKLKASICFCFSVHFNPNKDLFNLKKNIILFIENKNGEI